MQFCLTVCLLFISSLIYGQSGVYYDKSSKLPDTLNIKGTIEQISYGYCGFFCTDGVVKVKINNSLPDYPFKYIYMVTACLSTGVQKNTEISVMATKLLKTDKECYYQNIQNPFDRSKIKFYKLSEKETDKIR